MAEREYKELSCRDSGADCDFMVRSEREGEIMRMAGEHACEAHHLCDITPELKSKLQASIKTVWCEGACHNSPGVGAIPPWG